MTEPPQEKRIIRSSPGPEGKDLRLDAWLAGRFTYRSRTEWQNAVRAGEILLNGARTRPSRLLHGDEIIDFVVPDLPEPAVRTDFRVLAETPEYLAVEKPGDLPVHPSGCFFNHTLLMLLRKEYGELYPVNRIDRETSGIVLFARTPSAAATLANALTAGTVRKKYIVYVHGRAPEAPFRATGWLAPDPDSTIRKKRRFSYEEPDHPDAETSDTEFVHTESFGNISKLECLLHTGRLHQIRATLFSLGFPVVGDKLYGLDDTIFSRFADGKMTDADRKLLIIERQALHAFELKMTDPFDGKEKTFVSPVPAELTALEKG
ncbi:MAG: RluA family pseudouridine synthase [Lentisphaeria bacterium]|nr:RluA family pseudouridine synthase [Lentisphaeria bacterium]